MIVAPFLTFTPHPLVQAHDLVVAELYDRSVRITGSRGDGIKWIMVLKPTANTTKQPRDGFTYSANNEFGLGDDLGNSNYVVAIGTNGIDVTITGLAELTSYTVRVYEFNGRDGLEAYLLTTASDNPKTFTTLETPVAPANNARNLVFLGIERLEWEQPVSADAQRYLVVCKHGSPVDANPVDGVNYVANNTFGLGDEIGTGNFVIGNTAMLYVTNIKELLPSETYHFKVFAFNLSTGSTLYNTDDETNNPISKTFPALENWYLHNYPIVQPVRYHYRVKDYSQVVSKCGITGMSETSDEYQCYFIADNNANLFPEPWHFDQTFLATKSKTDGLPFNEGWSIYKSGDEPIPVFEFYDETVNASPNHTIQNHLCQPVVNGDNDFIAAYVANEANIATRYSIGIARSTDKGRTWTRNSSYAVVQNGTRSYFHPQLIKGTSNYFIVVLNFLKARYEVWKSTDGLTGNTYTLLNSNFLGDVDVWNELGSVSSGWQAIGPFKYEDSRWKFLAVRTLIGLYKSHPDTHPDRYIYSGGLFTDIIECYVPEIDTTNHKVVVEKLIYRTTKKTTLNVYPGTWYINHGSANHVLISSSMWRIENITQNTMDIKVLSDTPLLNNSTLHGKEVWPDVVTKFFIPNDTTQNDNYNQPVTAPIEYIDNETGSIVGTPLVYGLHRIKCTSSDYVTFNQWNFNKQYFGFKFVVSSAIDILNNTNRGLFEIEDVLKVFRYKGKNLEIWLYGDNGNIKKIRTGNSGTEESISVYAAGKYGPGTYCAIGATFMYNGIDDIDVIINIDDYLNVPTHAVHTGTQKFTQIAGNTNPLKIGAVSGMDSHLLPIGQLVVFEGSGIMQEKWHDFNLI